MKKNICLYMLILLNNLVAFAQDTLPAKPVMAGDSISLKANVENPLKTDSVLQKFKNQQKEISIKSLKPGIVKGTVSNSVNYGHPLISIPGNGSKLNYESTGDMHLQSKFPVGLKYRYDTYQFNQRNLVFDFYFDKDAFRKNYGKDKLDEKAAIQKEKKAIANEMAEVQKKLLYFQKKKSSFALPSEIPGKKNLKVPDSLSLKNKYQLPKSTVDTSAVEKGIPNVDNSLPSADTLNGLTKEGKDLEIDSKKMSLQQVDDSIKVLIGKYEALKGKLDAVDEKVKSVRLGKLKKPGLNERLNSVKDFRLGFFSPTYSKFLINQSVVCGGNLEFEDDIYFAITAGSMMNYYSPHYDSTAIEQNLFQKIIKPANFKSDTKVLAVKGGFGKKDETHLHVGLLKGEKQPQSFAGNDAIHPDKEKNLVLEFDGKYVLQHHSMELVWGKSTVTDEHSNILQSNESSLEHLIKENKNDAIFFGYTGDLQKIKTKVRLQSRLVEPFFKSFGVSYLRSDDLKLDLKVDHAFGKLKTTVRYIHEEDNLYKLYENKFKQQSVSLQLNYKVNRRLSLGWVATPIFYSIRRAEPPSTLFSRNLINTVIANYTPKSEKYFQNLTLVTTYNNLETDTQKYALLNSSLTEAIVFQNMDEISISAGFIDNIKGFESRKYLLDGGYSTMLFKKVKLSPQVHFIYTEDENLTTGYSLKVNYSFSKRFDVELNAEKNTYIYNTASRYETSYVQRSIPYYCYLKFNTNW